MELCVPCVCVCQHRVEGALGSGDRHTTDRRRTGIGLASGDSEWRLVRDRRRATRAGDSDKRLVRRTGDAVGPCGVREGSRAELSSVDSLGARPVY
jgi:hypothetical protein